MIHLIRGTPKYWHNINTQNMENISKMPFFQAYRKAVNLTLKNQYQQANVHFQQSLAKIREAKQDKLQHYIAILKKIASNNNKLGRFKATQNTLYQIIKHKKKYHVNSALIYDQYNLLFNHLLRFDIQKAIKLGKALLNEKQAQNIPLSHIKLFQFNLANAYLLEGNYPDAKKRYWKCLQSQPNNKLKSKVLNNLAISCWWHKNPLFSNISSSEYSSYDNSNIDRDFNQTVDLLKQSIAQSQNIQNMKNQQRRIELQQVLNQGKMLESVHFSQIQSITPIKNIAEFNINNNPLNSPEILFWLQQCLILSSLLKKSKQFDRVDTQLSLLSNDPNIQDKLENLIEKYNNTFEQNFYRKILFSYYIRQKQNQKALEQRQVLKNIILKYNQWQGKIQYLSLQTYNI